MDFDATDVDVDELVAGLAAHGRPVTLVVDGLDESTNPRQAAAVLRRTAAATAELGVRLLVGTRPGPQNKLLQALGAGAARTAIDLDDTTYLEKADLAEYVRRRLLLEGVPADRLPARDTPYRGHERLAERVGAGVADRAYPSFLIAALTAVGLVRRGTVVDVDAARLDQFPTTVADAMADYLDRFDQDRDRVEDLLRPLAYSYGDGLPADELWAGLATRLAGPGRTYTVTDIGWLLDTAADYLLETTADTRTGRAYRLYHQALIDHLPRTDRPRAGRGGGLPVAVDAVPRRSPGRCGLAACPSLHPDPPGRSRRRDRESRRPGRSPGFLLAADPSPLAARLRRLPRSPPPARAPIAWRPTCWPIVPTAFFNCSCMPRGSAKPPRRRFAALAVATSPRLAWTQEPRSTPHFTLGHTSAGCWRWRSASWTAARRGHRRLDATVRVWDCAPASRSGRR